ncbi:DUF2971 domain-containing protein [Agrobacterium tumefaciens]|jgi:hypothetical protein|uniref:DUF2971 domain-containing protein n=1 Tax=Agrobacterium tumefaciens TaxID=358 RepID=UPI0015742787|nr:DUF2971 domain-containing protein [Agrobacterium tumefaciens]WHO24096.1 DUF2971 domain-containing protein [Agrobacterium tumefaciens]
MPEILPTPNSVFKPEDFELSEAPPARLYKYMIADRVPDVLEGGMVRFTHLLDTNDSFEVRKTFKRFAGPKLISIMKGAVTSAFTPEYFDQQLNEQLSQRGINMPLAQVKAMIRQQFGMSVEDYMRSQMGGFVDMFVKGLDAVKSPEDFLMEIGAILMCFSLSERYDIATMWAHYGGNHTGLVIEFDTENAWFKNDGTHTSKLQKIRYLDEQNDELFDDLQAAFASKSTDWASEREWRINCSMKHIEKTINAGPEKIHLRSFPPEAVVSVIVGAKASHDTISTIRDILRRKYPHAALRQTTPQRMSSTFDLHDI